MTETRANGANRSVLWADKAWEDYLWWQEQDRKTLRKINSLIKSIKRDGLLSTPQRDTTPLLTPSSRCLSGIQ